MQYDWVSRRQLFRLAMAGIALAPAIGWALDAAPSVTADTKVYAFIVKKHGLTDEEFHAHWREPHARLTKKVPQIKRYLQNHGVGDPPTVPGFATTPYLGIATIWVADAGKLDEINHDPGFTEVHADELNLLERDQLAWLVSQETVVARGPGPSDIGRIPTKALLLLKRKSGVSPGAFRAGIAAVTESLPRALKRGRVTYALPADAAYTGDAQPPFDAVIEVAFRDDASFTAAWAHQGATTLIRLDQYADLSSSRGFLAHEERVIWPPLAH